MIVGAPPQDELGWMSLILNVRIATFLAVPMDAGFNGGLLQITLLDEYQNPERQPCMVREMTRSSYHGRVTQACQWVSQRPGLVSWGVAPGAGIVYTIDRIKGLEELNNERFELEPIIFF